MIIWYTARGAGLSALVLLTAATALGSYVSVRKSRGLATRTVLQYVHRAAGGLGIAVLLLHIGTVLLDSYAHVGVTGAIVPFTSSWRATWVGLGTIAAYLMLFTAVIGLVRARFANSQRGARTWRVLHGAGYLSWLIAIVHGYTSGTDSTQTWVRLLYLACVGTVAGAAAYRLLVHTPVDLVRGGQWQRADSTSLGAPL